MGCKRSKQAEAPKSETASSTLLTKPEEPKGKVPATQASVPETTPKELVANATAEKAQKTLNEASATQGSVPETAKAPREVLKCASLRAPNSFREASKGHQLEDDQLSTEGGTSSSSGSNSSSKSRADIDAPAKVENDEENQDSWFTPQLSFASAECRKFKQTGTSLIEAAVAAALAPEADATPGRTLRHRHSEETAQRTPHPKSDQDWWFDAETRIVPGLEAAPSLSRLLGADIISHPGLGRSQRPKPWLQGESHSCYWRLGARKASSSYVAFWLNVGDSSLLSLSEVIDRPALERCLANDPLGKRVKLLIRAVKCSLPFPGKGPKDADTVGAFFGKGASLSRGRNDEGCDILVLQIDLYYLMMLRFALQNVGFRQGNVVDIILVDWPGQAVLASVRLSVTDEFLKLKG